MTDFIYDVEMVEDDKPYSMGQVNTNEIPEEALTTYTQLLSQLLQQQDQGKRYAGFGFEGAEKLAFSALQIAEHDQIGAGMVYNPDDNGDNFVLIGRVFFCIKDRTVSFNMESNADDVLVQGEIDLRGYIQSFVVCFMAAWVELNKEYLPSNN
ncbi:molecular chaperone GroEL [Photobacterium kishitanii]|uniref:Molecular chaperone GroEL n=1 Tax=Photobacterium kishitanii TaxID=318456 RepID=A0A2T3KDM0_9GAMM|nr:hypothetical protein [Photobacterium kishitanii]KJG08881.1 molecular chaperone GroEL [Photobacterium kishitanii]KJG55696.1 molecular chaperone GroEL [Photobacterium kishitanii]KJG59139.1 molecular chaperone GroEL [Photobacterium kishitanii]KJG64068.1 molecular chaperone GroEL [Photobacterium kishitanii]KJG68217.1 molecular chaperone GroEL [Photobacterium kishitanii]